MSRETGGFGEAALVAREQTASSVWNVKMTTREPLLVGAAGGGLYVYDVASQQVIMDTDQGNIASDGGTAFQHVEDMDFIPSSPHICVCTQTGDGDSSCELVAVSLASKTRADILWRIDLHDYKNLFTIAACGERSVLVGTPEGARLLTFQNPFSEEEPQIESRSLVWEGNEIFTTAASERGETAVFAGRNHAVYCVSGLLAQERKVTELLGHTSDTFGSSISSDGKWVASANDDRTLRVWELPGDSLMVKSARFGKR